MAYYVAVKPCKFGGQRFLIGESIPADVIQPGAANNLLRMGIIAEASEGPATGTIEATQEERTQPVIEITIHAEEGDLDLTPTPEGLQAIFDVLSTNVSGAESIINGMTDEDALILLHISDSRKSIKELAENRAQAINTPQEDEESAGDD